MVVCRLADHADGPLVAFGADQVFETLFNGPGFVFPLEADHVVGIYHAWWDLFGDSDVVEVPHVFDEQKFVLFAGRVTALHQLERLSDLTGDLHSDGTC